MRIRFSAIFLLIAIFLQSCVVNETIVFNEDGSGEFLMNYDLSDMSKQMEQMMNPNGDSTGQNQDEEDKAPDTDEEAEAESYKETPEEKPIDTLIVFDELFVKFKDSIAALPESDRKTLESLRGMYMRFQSDESKDIFKMGFGMKFNSIEELQDVQKKVKAAREMNSEASNVKSMSENAPIDNIMGDGEMDVDYNFDGKTFSRTTTVPVKADKEDTDKMNEEDQSLNDSFKNAEYVVTYTFPERIKTSSKVDAEISKDRKTITYRISWLEFVKDPKAADIRIEFEHE